VTPFAGVSPGGAAVTSISNHLDLSASPWALPLVQFPPQPPPQEAVSEDAFSPEWTQSNHIIPTRNLVTSVNFESRHRVPCQCARTRAYARSGEMFSVPFFSCSIYGSFVTALTIFEIAVYLLNTRQAPACAGLGDN
jgi:hypothetical protein